MTSLILVFSVLLWDGETTWAMWATWVMLVLMLVLSLAWRQSGLAMLWRKQAKEFSDRRPERSLQRSLRAPSEDRSATRAAPTGLVVAAVAGVGSVLGAVSVSAFDASSVQTREFGGLSTELVFSGSAGLLVLGVVLTGRQVLSTWRARSRPSVKVAERVEQRTRELNDAWRAIAAITDQLQQDAENAQERVERLKKDIVTYEEAAKVSQAQAEAIERMIQSETARANRDSYRINLIQNGVFFVLGTGAGVLIQILLG